MKKRGQPARPRFNVRVSPEDALTEREESPFPDLVSDGRGLDFMLPPPPWGDASRHEMETNLAVLRVDPKASNYGRFETDIVRAIAGYDFEPFDIGKFFSELLSRWDAETSAAHFNDILRMRKQADEPPHRNFLAYQAYVDFLTEYGFQPTMPRLTEYIISKPAAYPVGISKPAGHKEWWALFFESGLVRLAE
jgi:hypothetical protein